MKIEAANRLKVTAAPDQFKKLRGLMTDALDKEDIQYTISPEKKVITIPRTDMKLPKLKTMVLKVMKPAGGVARSHGPGANYVDVGNTVVSLGLGERGFYINFSEQIDDE